MNARRLVGALAAMTLVSACAPSRSALFGELREDLDGRLPQRVHWYGGPAADDAVRATIRGLLRAPLTVDGAVQVALLSNRHVQASYERLGLSQADLLEAGMLANPVLGVAARFPKGGGLDIDLDIVTSVLSLILLPARSAIASAELRATGLSVADEVLRFAASVEKAYYHALATEQVAVVRRAIAETGAGSAELARALHEAGNLNERSMSEELVAFEDARVALAMAESDAVMAREDLIRAMGLFGMQTRFVLAGELPPVPESLPSLADAERDAVRDRLDLRAARQGVAILARSSGLADGTAWLAALDAGLSAERSEGSWSFGPAGSISVPLFNQGQAATSRAQARFLAAAHELVALAVDIRSDVRVARERMLEAQRVADHMRRVVVPLHDRIVELMQREYNFMLVGAFRLIAAKHRRDEAYVDYVGAVEAFWAARADFGRATGRPFATAPTSGPDVAPPAPAVPDTGLPEAPTGSEHHHVE